MLSSEARDLSFCLIGPDIMIYIDDMCKESGKNMPENIV